MSIMPANLVVIICVNVLINYSGIMNNKNVTGQIKFTVPNVRSSRFLWKLIHSVWKDPMDFLSTHIVSRLVCLFVFLANEILLLTNRL